jgi:hypothetical protein
MMNACGASIKSTRDRFLLWPLALTIGWPLVLMLVTIIPFVGFMLMVPMAAMMFWAPSAAVVFVVSIGWLRQRAWRRFLSAIVFPAVTLVGFLNYEASWTALREGGDLIHLWAMIPSYRLEIAKLPTDEPRLQYFDWEGFAAISFGALYDESDEVMKPAGERSAAWKKRAEDLLYCGILGGIPAGGHFYIIELGC